MRNVKKEFLKEIAARKQTNDIAAAKKQANDLAAAESLKRSLEESERVNGTLHESLRTLTEEVRCRFVVCLRASRYSTFDGISRTLYMRRTE
jgi:hypothetical protein